MRHNELRKFLIFVVILMSGAFAVVNFIAPEKARTTIIDGDGSGHYAYLPALFIHGTVDFTPVFNREKAHRALDYQGHYFHRRGDILINKYTSGTAFLEMPLFLVAWAASLITGLPADGYNPLFQYAVALSALMLVMIGFISLFKLMRSYGIDRRLIYMLSLCLLFGTNLFHYTFVAPAMSHAYSFGLISTFLYLVRSALLNYRPATIRKAAFLLGLIILVRPVNAMVLAFIPFLAPDPKSLINLMVKKIVRFEFVPSALLFLLALSPQFIINYFQTGELIVYGYRGEGFYFPNAEVINFLFSYQKGWFVYTPFMLLTIPALAMQYRRSARAFWTALIPVSIIIYVLSSWWNWIYGDSFGMRPMVDYYAFLILLIALMFKGFKTKPAWLFLAIYGGISIFLNLFQTSQYARGIIHPDSMTRDAYWYVFLRTGPEYEHVIGDNDEYFYGSLSTQAFFETKTNMGKPAKGWIVNRDRVREYEGYSVLQLDEGSLYGPTFDFYFSPEENGMNNIYVIFELEYRENRINSAMGSLFVVAITDADDELMFYKTFPLKRLPSGEVGTWKAGRIGFKLPEISSQMVKARMYVWNRDGLPLEIRNPSIRLHTYQP